jgi:hypothetical protein
MQNWKIVQTVQIFPGLKLSKYKLKQSISQLFRTESKLWEGLHYAMRRKIQF